MGLSVWSSSFFFHFGVSPPDTVTHPRSPHQLVCTSRDAAGKAPRTARLLSRSQLLTL